MKEYITINGVGGGIAKTVTAGYHKNYAASLLNFGTSGTFIMEKETEPKIIQNPHGFQKGGVKDVCPTITSSDFHENNFLQEAKGWRIRKLTPRECGRLQGCDDETIDKMIAAGIPKTQLYKLYGNSIVVDALYHIFRKLFIEQQNESRQLSLF